MTLVVPLMAALTLSFVEVSRRVFPWIVLPHMGVVPRVIVIAVIFVCMDGLNWFVTWRTTGCASFGDFTNCTTPRRT